MKISANAPFRVKDAIAKGDYKVYKQQHDTSQGPFTVERKWGDHEYRLVELQGNYDRTDLLKVEGAKKDPKPALPMAKKNQIYMSSYLADDEGQT